MPRVKIILNLIECFETEDITGPDEFYVVAAFGKGIAPNFDISPVKRGNWQLNNGQSVEPNVGLFSEEVEFNQEFAFGIRCFDKDASEDLTDADLEKAARSAERTANEAGQIAREVAPNESALARFALELIKGVIMFFWDFIKMITGLDKDDFLGEDLFTLAVPGVFNPATNTLGVPASFPAVWPRQFYCLYDGCRYRVTYTVFIG